MVASDYLVSCLATRMYSEPKDDGYFKSASGLGGLSVEVLVEISLSPHFPIPSTDTVMK